MGYLRGSAALTLLVASTALWLYAGPYGWNVLLRHGGTWWLTVRSDSRWLSPSMRLALAEAPVADPGLLEWRTLDDGFAIATLDALVDGRPVDRIRLARIDPARFRFEVRTAHRGDTTMDGWMAELHPALVVNGSYTNRYGRAATPLVSNGRRQGPDDYVARAGAFVSGDGRASVVDLRTTDFHAEINGASDAMVSFPLLIADGQTHVGRGSRWLANRSFVGQDRSGWIIVGTTDDAFFTLDRLARFLLRSPLQLKIALNLDGGPVASQAIALNGFSRVVRGRWEAQVDGKEVKLLAWPYGSVAMPVALIALRREGAAGPAEALSIRTAP